MLDFGYWQPGTDVDDELDAPIPGLPSKREREWEWRGLREYAAFLASTRIDPAREAIAREAEVRAHAALAVGDVSTAQVWADLAKTSRTPAPKEVEAEFLAEARHKSLSARFADVRARAEQLTLLAGTLAAAPTLALDPVDVPAVGLSAPTSIEITGPPRALALFGASPVPALAPPPCAPSSAMEAIAA